MGRSTYPGLYDAIGTMFGEGDGETTFNLPDLMDRFAQGSMTPGLKVEGGLPNITGSADCAVDGHSTVTGAFRHRGTTGGTFGGSSWVFGDIDFDASRVSPVYGLSDTVQPPALTLLPCIKAFDAATYPGLIDMSALANDVAHLSANKLDKTVDGNAVRYIAEAFSDGTNWYRKWSDGWVEQGCSSVSISQAQMTITLPVPFANTSYTLVTEVSQMGAGSFGEGVSVQVKTASSFTCHGYHSSGLITVPGMWYACGMGTNP